MNRHWHILLLTLLLCTGCTTEERPLEDNTNVDLQQDPESPADPGDSDGSQANSSDSLFRMGDWDSVQQLVKANPGKIVVIDIWSTYCAPCMKEFPRLIELQKKHGEKIKCVSFNINFAGLPDQSPESDIEFIQPFLQRHGDTVEHIVSTETDEKIYAQLDIYAIPAVLIYDTEGKLTHKVLEENAYEKTIFPSVAKMLGDSTTEGETDDQ